MKADITFHNKKDIEIAQEADMDLIKNIAAKLDLDEDVRETAQSTS